MSRSKRIYKELEDVKNDPTSGIFIECINDGDLTNLKGSFKGPPDSPYSEGKFLIDIQIPDEYPFKPPKMKFDTRVYHPNISSQTGAICLDVLKDAWTPILTLKSSLLSLQSLLQSPQPDDPQDAVVAQVLINDPKKFNETARHWTLIYAESDNNLLNKKNDGNNKTRGDEIDVDFDTISLFEEMGFDRNNILKTLKEIGVSNVRFDDIETQDLVIKCLSDTI